MQDKKLLGYYGEEMAAGMLYAQGYEILERNFRCKFGEADIICRNSKELFVVEVKTRTSMKYGRAAESVGRDKQNRLKKIGSWYMLSNKIDNLSIRFQVVEIMIRQNYFCF
ncbi:MAG: YraN family protein [Hornefia sp.]|nr:YraN family protein [Hornefia sp.]